MTDEERRRIRAALDLCEPLRLVPWAIDIICTHPYASDQSFSTPLARAREALDPSPQQEPVVRRVGSQVSTHQK